MIPFGDVRCNELKGEFARYVIYRANGCRSSAYALHVPRRVQLARVADRAPTLASSPTHPREDAMENFIHAGNLAIFKKRLAEVLSPAERKILLELQAEELARNPSPKK